MYGLLSVEGWIWRGQEGVWGGGGGGSMRDPDKRRGHSGWVRRQTQFGVVVFENINQLLSVVFE